MSIAQGRMGMMTARRQDGLGTPWSRGFMNEQNPKNSEISWKILVRLPTGGHRPNITRRNS